MAYRESRDEALLRTFYEDEQTLPRWFQDGANNWGIGWDEFKAFCGGCERIYSVNDRALVYVQSIGSNANIHFSLLRRRVGSTPDLISGLIEIRDVLLASYGMLFAYVGSHNRGLKRIVEQCGMRKSGLQMRKGSSHNKVLIWECFTVTKNYL